MPPNNQSRRLLSLGIVALVLMGTLTARMWFLQAVKAETNEEIVLSVRTRTIRLYPERGRIFDVKGRVVADNKRNAKYAPLHPPTQTNECLGNRKQNFTDRTCHCHRNGFVPPT